jgi:hypothetical protein
MESLSGVPQRTEPNSAVSARCGSDQVEMIEVAQVENLQIEPLDAGFMPALHRRRGLVGEAGNAVFSQLIRLPTDRIRPARELTLIGANNDDERCREGDRRRVATSRRTGVDDALVLNVEVAQRPEWDVELGRESRRQARGSLLSEAADHDRNTAFLESITS